jgi:hypothetical protein
MSEQQARPTLKGATIVVTTTTSTRRAITSHRHRISPSSCTKLQDLGILVSTTVQVGPYSIVSAAKDVLSTVDGPPPAFK